MIDKAQSRKRHNRRVIFMAAIALLAFAGISARLFILMLARGDRYQTLAVSQHHNTIRLTPKRGEILDCEGRTLALSVEARTLYVRADLLNQTQKQAIANALAEALGTNPESHMRRMRTPQRVMLAQRMDTEQASIVQEVIKDLNLPSRDYAYFDQETRRVYPRDTVAAPVIGYTRPDSTGMNTGATGLELTLNGLLRGRPASSEVRANSVAQRLEPLRAEALIESAGHRVHLTIDSVLQREAEDALMDALREFDADWGTCVLLDAQTSQVLAMANAPVYDLNSHAQSPDIAKRNHAMRVAVDMGSVMKIFTFAAALEDGLFTEDELIDCELGRWRHPLWNRVAVNDDSTHRIGVVPFHEAFAESSNVATIKLSRRFAPPIDPEADHRSQVRAERAGAARLVAHFQDFGFGRPTGIDLRGEVGGTLLSSGDWSATSFTTIPIGQGVTVTALQTASALCAIADGGVWRTPTIVARVEDAAGEVVAYEPEIEERRVLSGLTSQRMLRMMEEVVDHGTGEDAQIAGFRVGGKTGTADRMDEQTGQYVPRSYVSTFAGLAPVDDPEVVCVVFVSNPDRALGFYGGEVAAPVFQRVVSSALRQRGVTPNRPLEFAEGSLPGVVIESANSASAPAAQMMNLPVVDNGRMPALGGATMREVTRLMEQTGAQLHFEGTGRAVRQIPAAGEPIDSGMRIHVFFEEINPAIQIAEVLGE